MEEVAVAKLRKRLGFFINEVYHGRKEFTITRAKTPFAVLISAEEYKRLKQLDEKFKEEAQTD